MKTTTISPRHMSPPPIYCDEEGHRGQFSGPGKKQELGHLNSEMPLNTHGSAVRQTAEYTDLEYRK